MRELKFRAWHKKVEIMSQMPEEEHDGDYFSFLDDSGERLASDYSIGEAIQYGGIEVMQFTGLKDQNGVDIYEGDIVTWGDIEGYEEMSGTRYAVVDMSKPENGLTFSSFKPFKHEFKIGNFAYARSTEKCMTVIGSIHQHPELLEEK